jgi:hypothetical protein
MKRQDSPGRNAIGAGLGPDRRGGVAATSGPVRSRHAYDGRPAAAAVAPVPLDRLESPPLAGGAGANAATRTGSRGPTYAVARCCCCRCHRCCQPLPLRKEGHGLQMVTGTASRSLRPGASVLRSLRSQVLIPNKRHRWAVECHPSERKAWALACVRCCPGLLLHLAAVPRAVPWPVPMPACLSPLRGAR